LTLSHNEVLRNLEREAFYSHILTVKTGGAETQAILRDLQRHPSKAIIMHMDLQRISMKEKLKTHAPVHFIGEDVAPGVKAGGLVSHDLTEVSIECLPKDLPEFIEVDLSGLEIGESIHLSDLKIPEGVTLIDLARGDDHDSAVVSIHVKRVVEEEVEPTAEGEPAAEGGEEAKDADEGESS
jgi:large subunit ribosomal protein L25